MTTEHYPVPLGTFDEDGFFRAGEAWDEEIARRVAAQDGLGELNDRQLAVVRQLRKSVQDRGGFPALHHVCHLGGEEPDCMTRLFPSAREAWRIAGLPNPGEEAKAYL
jgi:sulfur relay (sulfurtransferase) DsrC/TusE family protein